MCTSTISIHIVFIHIYPIRIRISDNHAALDSDPNKKNYSKYSPTSRKHHWAPQVKWNFVLYI